MLTYLQPESKSPAGVALQILAAISDLVALSQGPYAQWYRTYPICDNETNSNKLLSEADDEAANFRRGNLSLRGKLDGCPYLNLALLTL